jgi:hypothetical protein
LKNIIKLKIADTVIQVQSKFKTRKLSKQEKTFQAFERFGNFFYKGNAVPDITIDVNVGDSLPVAKNTGILFITYHFQDGSENWRLLKKKNTYIYKSPLDDKKQVMLVNKNFNRVKAYLLPKKNYSSVQGNIEFTWDIADIMYDFLHVLLINYFAQRNSGIFAHATGIKDIDAGGLLFAGKSGSGKTTKAKIWHKNSEAMILNDDRIIIRKKKGKFRIYGCPWHGEFSDYLSSRIDDASLEKIFFIYHAKKNKAVRISQNEAFNLLYPAIFPVFWHKALLNNIVSFCHDIVACVPSYNFGFVDNEKVVGYVRGLK